MPPIQCFPEAQAAAAEPSLGAVLCDAATVAEAAGAATFEELPPLALKGKGATVRGGNT